jgi:hypothetical protein
MLRLGRPAQNLFRANQNLIVWNLLAMVDRERGYMGFIGSLSSPR